eukprot:scaffold25809_cov122-Cylindrotheca_fusiformis.AAC.2
MKEDGEFRILKDHHQHHHPLLQKGYCHEWMSKDGQRLCLYGTIVAAATIQSSSDDDGDNSESSFFFALQVEYSNASFLNEHYNSHHHHNTHHSNTIIPTHQYISKETAWGGCLLFSERERRNHDILLHNNNNNNNNHSLLWRVPDMYTRIAPSSSSTSSSFPTLILYYKTFQLTFTVQPSTIPKAGYGVFLAVNPTITTTTTALSSSSNRSSSSNTRMVFTLQPNELLDIGVYAPLTAEDWKEDAVMLVTSFIFEFEPEAYSFDATTTRLLNTSSKNSVYDITTLGSNGHMELSNTAKQHIPPYINECPRTTTTTTTKPHVHAQYDPQGSLHYLLGSIMDETEFQIEANGQAQEIF